MQIYIAAHKEFNIPDNKIYKAIIVGNNEVDLPNSLRDNSGDNISHLNYAYCELTALYWIWKNSNDDIVGLVHYRRYFKGVDGFITQGEVASLMLNYDIILPKKRNYIITDIKTHYGKAHYGQDLKRIRDLIIELEPDYLPSFDNVMSSRSISLYNMFLAKHEIISRYCNWLFPILDKFFISINLDDYDNYQKRVVGFISERLFNVWVNHSIDPKKIKYLNVINTEGEPKIKKGIALLKRQFFSKVIE